MSDTPRLKTLLIGVDAGCLPVFERLSEGNHIPTIQRLCEEGISTPLESQIPPWTPSAWPSLYTGVNPGKHGAIGFVGYDGYDWHVTARDDVDEHSLWTLLDQHGHSSVVVNVPITHPPDEFDGALIPGFIGPEDPTCHPRGLLDDVRDAIGEYRVYPNYTRGDARLSDEEKIDEYRTLIRMRGDAFRYLVERYEPDFGFVQFQKTDTVFHEFQGDEEKVATVYETTDEQIRSILDTCDPRRIFLVSDHGMGVYDGYQFRINEFLRDGGYLETTTSGKGMPSWHPIRQELREGTRSRTWNPGKVARAAAFAARFGVTARRARLALEAVRLDGLVRRYVPGNVTRTANEQVDFESSRAYVRARTELGVRINRQGRDPAGVVAPDEYDTLRAELIQELEGIETPDGDPVFEEVAPRERYFHGEHDEKAVDIVTIPADFDHAITEQLGDDWFGPPERWNHKLDGVFVAAGDDIDVDAPIDRTHLFDVAPTVMAALDVPYSDRMDGALVPIVEDPGSQTYPAYGTGQNVETAEVDDEVTTRLADLGYLN